MCLKYDEVESKGVDVVLVDGWVACLTFMREKGYPVTDWTGN